MFHVHAVEGSNLDFPIYNSLSRKVSDVYLRAKELIWYLCSNNLTGMQENCRLAV